MNGHLLLIVNMARIYTERMQEVLDPISTSISLLLSKVEESEETGSTLSDLSGPSAAVYAACQVCNVFIDVARSIVGE